MARRRITEYKAKKLVLEVLGLPYQGIFFDSPTDFPKVQLDPAKKYIVKVDEGVKKRFKQGLVGLNKNPSEIVAEINRMRELGFSQFLIEEYVEHDASEEKYLAFERVRDGVQVYYSNKGGVNIEENSDSVKKLLIPYSYSSAVEKFDNDSSRLSLDKLGIARTIKSDLDLDEQLINKLLTVFDKFYFSFMEINPFLIHDSSFLILDLAVEVDSTASFFVEDSWSEVDFTFGSTKQITQEEKAIEQLASKSQAAFTMKVLNPNGSIFMLLSGGGASIVLADEVANLGFGDKMANYGEYSGNPNAEETYIYTKNLLSLLLKSSAVKKVLIVAGGVANFTDIRITFRGIIQALGEVKTELQKQGVKVFVRRGGPNQEEGLAMMKTFLEKENLFGDVCGPDIVLTDIVKKAISSL